MLIIFIFTYPLYSQANRETRAVWVSTNHRLDWPPQTFNEEKQKEELKRIFDNIESKNLNTVYFQVRSNGTLLFKSSLELFSPYITGNIGEFGTYDPLEFAVKEAHRRGLEIHAWVNTNKIFSGNNISIKKNPLHISQINPSWVYEKADNSVWLDPGIPEVRNYLVELFSEIVENYNVDGIQLDYIRYPKEPIYDDRSYTLYGEGVERQQWRRDNITKFITALNKRIKKSNPKIKLGVTPIGIYKSIPNGSGMEGYSDVFQDTREWLRLGIIDYAVPQIYWNVKDNPKFDVLTSDWVNNSYGRHIVIGVGAYKPEVLNEIERQINITRTAKASGVAFFRYQNIATKRFFLFNEKVLPPVMNWIEGATQLAGLQIASNYYNRNISIFLNTDKIYSPKGRFFALYEENKIGDEWNSKLIKVVPNYTSDVSFTLSQPDRINYFYSAIMFNQLWSEVSYKSNITKVTIPHLKETEESIKIFSNPILIKDRNRNLILLYSDLEEKIILYGKNTNGKRLVLSKHFLKQGINHISLNFDISNYSTVIIDFQKSNRSVSLSINNP